MSIQIFDMYIYTHLKFGVVVAKHNFKWVRKMFYNVGLYVLINDAICM